MVARPALLLDQHDIEIAGEIGSKPGAGNARADDRDVGRDRVGQALPLHPLSHELPCNGPGNHGEPTHVSHRTGRYESRPCHSAGDALQPTPLLLAAIGQPASLTNVITSHIKMHRPTAAVRKSAMPDDEPCLIFRDLTLGYNSHPAVHHLDGTVATGSLTAVVGANGSGKSTLMKGIVGVLKPMAGEIVNARRRAHRLSAAAIGARPHLSGAGRRPGFARPVAEARAARPLSPPRTATAVAKALIGGRPRRLREAADRHAVGRPAAARAVCARAGAGRRDHPARRAVQRDRRQDGRST